jgi:predicted RNase H-like nuclease
MPKISLVDRRRRILKEWDRIISRLSRNIDGIVLPLPSTSAKGSLKRYEDALDALICAWVGIEYLEGRAVPYGDA